ncbi:hypothetical protein BAU67_001960 [Escherichia coli]|nr:hypothetical protein [Escherichia coli]EMB7054201.1 hypothetical protein [Escherichia coli]
MKYVKIVIVNSHGDLSDFGISDGDVITAMAPTLGSVASAVEGREEMMSYNGLDVEYLTNCMRRDQVLLYKSVDKDGNASWAVLHPDIYEIINILPNDDDEDEIRTLMACM